MLAHIIENLTNKQNLLHLHLLLWDMPGHKLLHSYLLNLIERIQLCDYNITFEDRLLITSDKIRISNGEDIEGITSYETIDHKSDKSSNDKDKDANTENISTTSKVIRHYRLFELILLIDKRLLKLSIRLS